LTINKRLLAAIAVFGFVVALAVMLAMRLSETAAAIALGVALGVMIGVPVGVVTALVVIRRGWFTREESQQSALEPGMLLLTPEQSEALLAGLQRPQASPAEVLPRPALKRDFTVVGGADLSQSFDEGD
jgi:hypothetical protein